MEKRGIQFQSVSKDQAKKYLNRINYYKITGYMKSFETGTDFYEAVDFK